MTFSPVDATFKLRTFLGLKKKEKGRKGGQVVFLRGTWVRLRGTIRNSSVCPYKLKPKQKMEWSAWA
jgi:hypothetical protein